jgi:hypothetical protein
MGVLDGLAVGSGATGVFVLVGVVGSGVGVDWAWQAASPPSRSKMSAVAANFFIAVSRI